MSYLEQLRVRLTIFHTALTEPRVALSSRANPPPGQQEAGSGPTVQETGPWQSCPVWKAHCCSCIPQGAFLLLSEDVALPQEEEGTSCYWMCGLRLSGIFCMPQPQLWELGMRLRSPGLGRPRGVAAVQKLRSSGSWEAEMTPAMLTPPVPSDALIF